MQIGANYEDFLISFLHILTGFWDCDMIKISKIGSLYLVGGDV